MQKTEAIIIYSFPFKDKKYMLEVFTRDHGRMSFVTNKRMQPLSIMNIVYDEHRNKLSSADISYAYTDLLYNPHKLSISFFVAEFLRYATRNEPTNTPLYDYLRQALEWLDIVQESFANFHLVLMMRVSLFLGLTPDIQRYEPTSYFDLREGCFTEVVPFHNDYLSRVQSAVFVRLMRMNFSTLHLFQLNKDQRNIITNLLIHYYRLHVPGFPEMKSLEVLRELF